MLLQRCENDGCSVLDVQMQGCCCVASAALPCNDEVPVLVNVLGLNLYPSVGCCKTIGAIKSEAMAR